MSDEVDVIDQDPGATTEMLEPTGVEESMSFVDEGSTGEGEDEVGLLEAIDKRFEEEGLIEPSEIEEEEEPTGEDTEEKPTGEDEEDLAKDFPTEDEAADVLKDEKAKVKWGEMRTELDVSRKQVRDLEAKLDDTQKQSVATELEKQLEEARDETARLEGELSVARVERSPEYKRLVEQPLQSVMNAAEELATRNELDVDRIFDILANTDNLDRRNKDLAELTENLSEPDKFSLYQMVQDASYLFQKDSELKNMAAEAAAELEQREAWQAQEDAKKEAVAVRQGVRDVFKKLEKVTPKLVGEDSLEKLQEKTLTEDFAQLGIDHKAFALSAATTLPALIRALQGRDKTIAKLEKDISGYDKASPKVRGSGVKGAPTTPDDDDLGFLEGVEKRLNDAGY